MIVILALNKKLNYEISTPILLEEKKFLSVVPLWCEFIFSISNEILANDQRKNLNNLGHYYISVILQ
jgi:hypothetical protein